MSSPATYGFTYWSALYGSGDIEYGEAVTWDDLSDPDVLAPVGLFDYYTSAQNRIWKQFEETTTWPDLMDIIAESFDEVEIQLAEINDHRAVSTAYGIQLDAIGALVGRSRGTLDDDAYRRAIVVDANTLFSSGTPWQISELARSLYPTRVVTLTEFYPAAFSLQIVDLTLEEFDLLLDIMADTPPAGVGALLESIPSGMAYGPDSVVANAIEPLGTPGSVAGGDGELFSNFSHVESL